VYLQKRGKKRAARNIIIPTFYPKVKKYLHLTVKKFFYVAVQNYRSISISKFSNPCQAETTYQTISTRRPHPDLESNVAEPSVVEHDAAQPCFSQLGHETPDVGLGGTPGDSG
jgi:hypothetical protein